MRTLILSAVLVAGFCTVTNGAEVVFGFGDGNTVQEASLDALTDLANNLVTLTGGDGLYDLNDLVLVDEYWQNGQAFVILSLTVYENVVEQFELDLIFDRWLFGTLGGDVVLWGAKDPMDPFLQMLFESLGESNEGQSTNDEWFNFPPPNSSSDWDQSGGGQSDDAQ